MFFEAELNRVYKISEINVKTLNFITYLYNIVVLVGNFSGGGNYSGYQEVGHYSGIPYQGIILNFKVTKPIYGKYVAFQSPLFFNLVIAELQIVS